MSDHDYESRRHSKRKAEWGRQEEHKMQMPTSLVSRAEKRAHSLRVLRTCLRLPSQLLSPGIFNNKMNC